MTKYRQLPLFGQEFAKQMALGKVSEPLKQREIWATQLLLLQKGLASQTGWVTIDDATPKLQFSFNDGGKWRGQITLSLKLEGVIRPDNTTRSSRPSRHRGYITKWRIADRIKARLKIKWLREKLKTLVSEGESNE